MVLLGGGPANGLAALRLKQLRPEIEFLLIEKGPVLGGNHTWSFHEKELTPNEWDWIRPFITSRWPRYEVVFPGFRKILSTAYASISSKQFHQLLMEYLSWHVRLNTEVAKVEPERVILNTGEEIFCGAVWDGRGWQDHPDVPVAYQKFFGLDVVTKQPHGLDHPVLMDATVDQQVDFRFFYVLPWSERRLLIEETRYSDNNNLDIDNARKNTVDYAAKKGWEIESVAREEQGVLPIPLSGALPPWPKDIVFSGSKAGLFNATTGYAFPQAVHFADKLAARQNFYNPDIYDWARSEAERHWERQGFYRFLNRMLFRAAEPSQRYKVMEKFYRYSDPLVARFYASRLNMIDQLRLFSGRPPVPLRKAIKYLF